MKITLIRMRREVACVKHGKPSYRWTNGYLVKNPINGMLVYPPESLNGAKCTARTLFGKVDEFVIEDKP